MLSSAQLSSAPPFLMEYTRLTIISTTATAIAIATTATATATTTTTIATTITATMNIDSGFRIQSMTRANNWTIN